MEETAAEAEWNGLWHFVLWCQYHFPKSTTIGIFSLKADTWSDNGLSTFSKACSVSLFLELYDSISK